MKDLKGRSVSAVSVELGKRLEHEKLWRLLRLAEDFTGANRSTVSAWFEGRQSPSGEYLLRMVFLLEAMGLESKELLTLEEPVRSLGRIVGYQAHPLEAVRKYMGYGSRDSLTRLLRGGSSPSGKKKRLIRTLVEESGEKLERRVLRLRTKLSEIGLPEVSAEIGLKERPALLPEHSGVSDEVYQAFEKQVEFMIALTEYFLSENVSAEERRRLRQELGQDVMFNLSVNFHRLCSETAKKVFKDREKKEKKK